jgi:hypothetical protein
MRYQSKDTLQGIDYIIQAKNKLQTLKQEDRDELAEIKKYLVYKIDGLGHAGADELMLKLGSFLNSSRYHE